MGLTVCQWHCACLNVWSVTLSYDPQGRYVDFQVLHGTTEIISDGLKEQNTTEVFVDFMLKYIKREISRNDVCGWKEDALVFKA